MRCESGFEVVGSGDGWLVGRCLIPAVELVGKNCQCYLPRIAGEVIDLCMVDTSNV